MSVADRPGVLARIASIFGDEELSIRSVVQSGSGDEASLVLIAARRARRSAWTAVAGLRALDDVRGDPVLLRVLGGGEGGG